MDKHLSIDPSNESTKHQRLFIKTTNVQDEEESDCPLLTPSPPPSHVLTPSEDILVNSETTMFNRLDNDSGAIEDIKTAVATALTIHSSHNTNSNNGEASSRDPMVESTSSEESHKQQKEPVCTQLLTQLNTAYQHLAPDAQAVFYSQENGGKAPMVGIQVIMPKSPKDFSFTRWNWPQIRRICFWLMIGVLSSVVTVAVRGIITMPRRCDPAVNWWQGKLFYEIFPASFQDSSSIGDGIGDIGGIIMRMNYIKNLGIKTIRLNSIFQSTHYPEHYTAVTNLTAIDENVGSMMDFDNLMDNIHRNDMKLVLDIPLHDYISKKMMDKNGKVHFNQHKMNLQDSDDSVPKYGRIKRDSIDKSVKNANLTKSISGPKKTDVKMSITSNQTSANISAMPLPKYERYILPNFVDMTNDPLHDITLALKYWRHKNVDGFYLKGIEYYVDDENIINFLNLWRIIMGPDCILMCNWKALKSANKYEVRDKLIEVIDLFDVTLTLTNGTKNIKKQIDDVLTDIFFDNEKIDLNERTWIHWSVGNVDTKRIASSLTMRNASTAAMIMAMMLPGTPSIFYGDEIGLTECPCEDHKDLEKLHNLSPMPWSIILHNKTEKFSPHAVMPWIPISSISPQAHMEMSIPQMVNLRQIAASIYIEMAQKHDRITINSQIRYSDDELMVFERWYPRQNTYVFIGNFGNNTQKKDFSSFYYGGEVVIGPSKQLHETIGFKEFIIAPGDAYVIKLKK